MVTFEFWIEFWLLRASVSSSSPLEIPPKFFTFDFFSFIEIPPKWFFYGFFAWRFCQIRQIFKNSWKHTRSPSGIVDSGGNRSQNTSTFFETSSKQKCWHCWPSVNFSCKNCRVKWAEWLCFSSIFRNSDVVIFTFWNFVKTNLVGILRSWAFCSSICEWKILCQIIKICQNTLEVLWPHSFLSGCSSLDTIQWDNDTKTKSSLVWFFLEFQ